MSDESDIKDKITPYLHEHVSVKTLVRSGTLEKSDTITYISFASFDNMSISIRPVIWARRAFKL